ncbi:MAG: hypothetical protein J7500_00970 [Sphingomonas sp.]|uniref:hypothetical protein n=1 Tax=Sphingomonas sp. TaxID=28214 RepID=UPI001B208906|nr:hypothetical protein [Sphingomonas sp.]MBO9621259.1 hypothetical protein [Sphingomonas sp.]
MNDPDGRYASSEIRTRIGPAGQPVAYLARRFLPEPDSLTIAGIAQMAPGERLDLLSARVQGVSTAWWRIADAHRLIHPGDLEEPGLQRLKVPLPEPGR